MSYIILKDTPEIGFETIPGIGLKAVEEHQIDDFICQAATAIIEKEGWDGLEGYNGGNDIPMHDTLAIFKLSGKFRETFVDDYIERVLEEHEARERQEELELYLKLKEKFEK